MCKCIRFLHSFLVRIAIFPHFPCKAICGPLLFNSIAQPLFELWFVGRTNYTQHTWSMESEYTFYVNEKEWMSKDRKTRKKSITKRASHLLVGWKKSVVRFIWWITVWLRKGKAPTIDKRYLNRINSKHDVYAVAVIVRIALYDVRYICIHYRYMRPNRNAYERNSHEYVDFDKTI